MHVSDQKQYVNNKYFCKKKKVYLKFFLDSWADLAFADIAACCSHHISILLLVHHDLKIVTSVVYKLSRWMERVAVGGDQRTHVQVKSP